MKITVPVLQGYKAKKQKIAVLTCYDFRTAQLLSEAGVDMLLVGDSLGMVKLGYSSTLPVTVEDVLYHTKLVTRAKPKALVVADMPYLSYHISVEDAVRACGRMIQEGGAEAVKIEGGHEMIPVFEALRKAKIPVLGHLGMTPQSVNQLGGFKVQARSSADAKNLLSAAKAVQSAGAFGIVLECVPSAVAKRVTQTLRIPTIGIGAGVGCDGQVLVIDDVLGMTLAPHPRFVKSYAQLSDTIQQAASDYVRDVRSGRFPDAAHSYE